MVVCLVETSKVCLHCDDQCSARFIGSGPVVGFSERHLLVSCDGMGVPRCSHLRTGFTLSGCDERVIGVRDRIGCMHLDKSRCSHNPTGVSGHA
jgi:hypothetical protein